MTAAAVLGAHAIAAVLFALLALAQLSRGTPGLPRRPFQAALWSTALWALAVAGLGSRDVVAHLAECARDLAWLGFMLAVVRRAARGAQRTAVTAIYGVVALIAIGAALLGVAQVASWRGEAAALLDEARLILQMMVAIGALVLVHHLYDAARRQGASGGAGLAATAIGVLWAVDLGLYAAAFVTGSWPLELVAARGAATILLAPMLAIAAHRGGEWTLQLSRALAWQSLSALVVALYVGAMLLGTSLIGAVGGGVGGVGGARIAQTAFVFGTTTALITVISTPWLRAWARVKLAKHLFRHRYDYRAEWVRFTDTLGRPDGDPAVPLDARVVKALADLTDSPGGLLLLPDGAGLGVGAAWNWEALPEGDGGDALTAYLARSKRIVELDQVRAGTGDAEERAAIPAWLRDHLAAWVLVPLVHFEALAGVIVLARPPVDRALDWEDFDLLRIAGRQAASYLAEDRAHDALAEARRFDEFNRRFAFILHDIKNLVSQLSLVARNAERHADNPEFRRDMVATLRDSSERMNALLARLSQQHRSRDDDIRPTDVASVVGRVVAARRVHHPIVVEVRGPALAMADAARLEQLLGHLVQNAMEASSPRDAVVIALGATAGAVTIEVIDRGCGMAPGFVRDQLFRPFVSSKASGFGIGAFEARQLAAAMGGAIEVTSREGEGSRFRVTLRAAEAWEAAA